MTVTLLSSACWYLSHQSACYDRLGRTWVRASCTSVETCLETCLELPKSRYLIFLYSDWMDQFEGSRGFDDHQWNSSATHESSRVIILKLRLNSTGHSACTSEVRDIFDRQTYVPNDWWQLLCSNVLQSWDRRNSMTAPVVILQYESSLKGLDYDKRNPRKPKSSEYKIKDNSIHHRWCK